MEHEHEWTHFVLLRFYKFRSIITTRRLLWENEDGDDDRYGEGMALRHDHTCHFHAGFNVTYH